MTFSDGQHIGILVKGGDLAPQLSVRALHSSMPPSRPASVRVPTCVTRGGGLCSLLNLVPLRCKLSIKWNFTLHWFVLVERVTGAKAGYAVSTDAACCKGSGTGIIYSWPHR